MGIMALVLVVMARAVTAIHRATAGDKRVIKTEMVIDGTGGDSGDRAGYGDG